MKKLVVLALLIGTVGLGLVGCGGLSNSTSMDAAKTFMGALTQGDSDTLKQIDHSSPFDFPPQSMIESANGAGLVGMKVDDITLKQVNDLTVLASWKDKAGQIERWNMEFVKEKDGYFFDRLTH